MTDGDTLAIGSLPSIHPLGGRTFLYLAPFLVTRLAYDPVRLAAGISRRPVVVSRFSATGLSETVTLVFNWAGYAQEWRDICEDFLTNMPESHITEFAAVVVAMLLIHGFEGATSKRVSEYGSRSDYQIRLRDGNDQVIECSGIRTGSRADLDYRSNSKRDRLFTARDDGYISVTLFQSPQGEVLSDLRFVKKTAGVTP